MMLLKVLFISLLTKTRANIPACKLQGVTGFTELSQDGDLVLAGIFSLDSSPKSEDFDYRTEPFNLKCQSKNYRELKYARTLIFTLDEINKNRELLPNTTLGYKIFNACGSNNLLRAAMEAVVGEKRQLTQEQSCRRVQAIIGHSSSGPSKIINTATNPLQIPQISYLSTCACLSNRLIYPTFFRTVPSDHFQVIALVQLMKHYSWYWVGVAYSYGTYAEEGKDEFTKEARKEGICIEYTVYYIKKHSESKIFETVNTIKTSTSKVVLAFMSSSYLESFLDIMVTNNVTGKQWIGSESWITKASLATLERMKILKGAIGFAIPEAPIPGLSEFLLSLKPSDSPQSPFIRTLWEHVFHCSLSVTNNSDTKQCTGTEDLRTVNNSYTDTAESRTVNNVYKAVYAVAHALHRLLLCDNGINPITKEGCLKSANIEPWQVAKSLRKVNFTTASGHNVYFDENGNSVAQYDLVNWQFNNDGSVKIVNVGCYDASLPFGQKFKMNDNVTIMWGGDHYEVPRSVCTDSCPLGSRKAINKRRPVCCFDCIKCADGEISNETDSLDCMKCPSEYWSSENNDECILKPTEFLSYTENMGSLLVLFSCIGVFLTLLISIIFFIFKETPIVKANNSELSFLLLFSLKLCFLCSLTFIGRPSEWSCMLRHTAFGITFVLCISCVLGKTIVVLMAFRATLPGSNVMKWFGPLQQRLSVFAFTLVQILICVLWLTISPPFPYKNMNHYKDKIILECDGGSGIGFWAVLGYIGLLAVLCFVLAFLARKLPDNFNEAKFITFSMFIFCAVWITFIPAYVSSPGKFTVAVEIFAILASSFGLLLCIFIPKCYIIVLKPELNSKKQLMGKAALNSHQDSQ